jgi:hypothetical protein
VATNGNVPTEHITGLSRMERVFWA